MPVSPEMFAKTIERSRDLINKTQINVPNSVNENLYNSQPDLDYSSPYGDDGSEESYINTSEPVFNSQTAKNSKLPEAIKQSMLSEQIDVSAANPNNSKLDRILENVPAFKKVKPNVSYVPNKIKENTSQSVDYTIIKAIVNECLEEKIKELKTQILNESTLKTIGLNKGRIQLVDNKGNIFSAQLKHEGNINDK